MTTHYHTNFFQHCATLDELKAEFRHLAKLHHPDVGGDTATMQVINAEFDRLFPLFKFRHNSVSESVSNHETAASVRHDFYTANGWAGSNYDSARSTKEIAAIVRRYVKDKYPRYKFSVRTKSASLCSEIVCEMLEAPTEIYKTLDELTESDREHIIHKANYNNIWTLNSWSRAECNAEILRLWNTEGDWYKIISDEIQAVTNDVDDFVKSYNYDDCDGMIDYFDVNFYYFGCLQSNGRNVKFVPRENTKKRSAQQNQNQKPLRVSFCPEHDGVEVYFPTKPAVSVLSALKADGWRWHKSKQCWYNRNTESHLQTLRAATESDSLPA